MDEVVVVDCQTGELVRRPLTQEETVQRGKDLEEAQSVERAKGVHRTEQEMTLGKVATAVGVPVDDLKRALGAGELQVTPDPDKAAKVEARDTRPK